MIVTNCRVNTQVAEDSVLVNNTVQVGELSDEANTSAGSVGQADSRSSTAARLMRGMQLSILMQKKYFN